jgi:ubiquinone/menaquinone biosynthesis C-methylase UbiE
LRPIFSEIHRVLKSGGVMMYLAVHPMRQFFEKKESNGNYFEQKIVNSRVFQNQITFKEPTHTLGEYLSNFLFENFDVKMFAEYWEPCAEQIDSKKYPGFFIVKAEKR